MIESKWILPGEDASCPRGLMKRVFGRERDDIGKYATFAVLYESGRPIAAGALYHSADGFHIDGLCVLEEERGKYVGDLLVRLILWKAMQFADRLTADVPEAAEGFFAPFGFRRTGESPDGVLRMTLKKENFVLPSKCGGHPHA